MEGMERFVADETKQEIKLTVVSDGTPYGLDVIDVVTGRRVHGLQAVKLFAHYEGKPHFISAEVKFTVYEDVNSIGVRMTQEMFQALKERRNELVEVVEDGQ